MPSTPDIPPHSSVDTSSKAEEDWISKMEYEGLSRFHKFYRSKAPPHDDLKKMLPHRIDAVFRHHLHVLESSKKTSKSSAPFRVSIEFRSGKTKRFLFHHGEDAIEKVLEYLPPALKGNIRVWSKSKFHTDLSKRHLCTKVSSDLPMIGMYKFITTYNWKWTNTRLPRILKYLHQNTPYEVTENKHIRNYLEL